MIYTLLVIVIGIISFLIYKIFIKNVRMIKNYRS